MKPWLMEVNITPSLNTESPLDNMIKTRLMSDTFNLIGLKLNTRDGKNEEDDDEDEIRGEDEGEENNKR